MKHKFARDSDPLEHEILREDMMPCCTAMLDGEYSLMPTVEHITTELLGSTHPLFPIFSSITL